MTDGKRNKSMPFRAHIQGSAEEFYILWLINSTDCVDKRKIKMYYTCNDKLMYGENNGAEYFKI